MSTTKKRKLQIKKANDWDRLNELIKIKERSLKIHILEMDELRKDNEQLRKKLYEATVNEAPPICHTCKWLKAVVGVDGVFRPCDDCG